MARTRGRLHQEAPREPSYQKLRGKLRTERWEAKIGGITNLNIPDRGTLDARGESFTGLDRMKVKALTLTEAEQASNSTDGRVLASGSTNPERAVDTAHIKDSAVTNRVLAADSVDTAQLKNSAITAGKLPAGTKIGQIKARPTGTPDDMDWGGQGSVPKGALPALSDSDIGGMGKYLTDIPAGYVKKSELKDSAFK